MSSFPGVIGNVIVEGEEFIFQLRYKKLRVGISLQAAAPDEEVIARVLENAAKNIREAYAQANTQTIPTNS